MAESDPTELRAQIDHILHELLCSDQLTEEEKLSILSEALKISSEE